MNTNTQQAVTSKQLPKLNKKQKQSITVWSAINQSLVEQFKPIEIVEHTNTLKVPKQVPSQRLINQISQLKQQIQVNQQAVTSNLNTINKSKIAQQIFDEERSKGPLIRKSVINRLKLEAELTEAGAATYFQNMKKKAGLVNTR